VHEEALAETVTAVGATNLVAKEEGRIAVLVLHALLHRDRGLVRCIELAPILELFHARDYELADGIVRIVPVDESEVIVVRAEDVLLGDPLQRLSLMRRDLRELRDVAHVGDLPLPSRRRRQGRQGHGTLLGKARRSARPRATTVQFTPERPDPARSRRLGWMRSETNAPTSRPSVARRSPSESSRQAGTAPRRPRSTTRRSWSERSG